MESFLFLFKRLLKLFNGSHKILYQIHYHLWAIIIVCAFLFALCVFKFNIIFIIIYCIYKNYRSYIVQHLKIRRHYRLLTGNAESVFSTVICIFFNWTKLWKIETLCCALDKKKKKTLVYSAAQKNSDILLFMVYVTASSAFFEYITVYGW